MVSGDGRMMAAGTLSFSRSAGSARARNEGVAFSHGWENAGVPAAIMRPSPGTIARATTQPKRLLADAEAGEDRVEQGLGGVAAGESSECGAGVG